MSLKPKEIAISKAVSVKLTDDMIAIVAHVYHTADRKTNPNDTSWYKYVGRVAKISDLEAEIATLKDPANRLNAWHWECPAWPADWFFGYDDSNTQAKASRWLQMKIKKALTWDAYVKLVKDGIKHVASLGKEKAYPGGMYDVEGYQDFKGVTFDITDKEALISHCGQTFWKDCVAKRQLPKV